VLERLLEELSFDAPEKAGETVSVTREMVEERLGELLGNQDLARYIL
jgi:ATP-dependent HslUV protease ATP-binding subunit HslU